MNKILTVQSFNTILSRSKAFEITVLSTIIRALFKFIQMSRDKNLTVHTKTIKLVILNFNDLSVSFTSPIIYQFQSAFVTFQYLPSSSLHEPIH